MKEKFPYDDNIKIKSEEMVWKLYNDNDEFDLGLTNKQIGQKTDEKFNITWYQYDSERVRNVVRKFRKIDINEKADEILEAYKPLESTDITINKKKILVLNDIHIPFIRDDVFDIIKKHKDEIKAIVFGGDILDCEEISSFPAIEKYPIEQELIDGITFFKHVRSIVGKDVKIILVDGNHEARWKRFIAQQHAQQMYKFINPNVLEMLRDGLTLYENGERKVYEGVPDLIVMNSWYVNINKEIIVCHPFNFSKIEIKNAKNAIEYFISRHEEFSTMIVAHNHHQAECSNYLGRYGIETGCMCQPFEYAEGRTSGKPQDYGYFIVGLDDNGHVDKNECKLYKLDCEDIFGEKSQINI